jgi:hypothetical protein
VNLATDPSRFTPYHESLTATVARTGGIAIIVASIATLTRLGHLPASSAQWHNWFALFVFVAWPSFGGHWIELAYLNGLRPRIAHWSDVSLIFVRLGVWLIGGTILFLGAVVSYGLLTTGKLPDQSLVLKALLLGGPVFVAVEFFPHTFLQLRGRPSFWNLRG